MPRGVITNTGHPRGPRGAMLPQNTALIELCSFWNCRAGRVKLSPCCFSQLCSPQTLRLNAQTSFWATAVSGCVHIGCVAVSPRYTGIHTPCAHTHMVHSHTKPCPKVCTPCAKKSRIKSSSSRLLCPRLPSHTTRLLFSMACPLWGPWGSVLVICLHLCPLLESIEEVFQTFSNKVEPKKKR